MATVSPASDQATDLLQNLTLDTKTQKSETTVATDKPTAASNVSAPTLPADRSLTPLLQESGDSSMYYVPATYYYGMYGGSANMWSDGELSSPGVYGDMYHGGYGYVPYSPYPSPGSPAPSLGHDGSFYGTQQYQFPGSFYQPQIPKKATYTKRSSASTQGDISTSKVSDTATISADATNPGSNSMNGSKNWKKGSYAKVATGNGVATSSYPNQTWVGKKQPWSEGNISSDKQNVPAVTSTGSTTGLSGNNKLQGKNQNLRPLPHYTPSSRPTTQGFMNRMYPYNGMGLYTNNTLRPNLGFGSHLYGSRLAGGWGPLMGVNDKQKPKGRGNGFNFFSNENFDGLSELNRGPRTGKPKVQTCQTSLPVNGGTENGSAPLPAEKDCYNREDFADTYADAKFFVIKSYSEDDVHKSVKYGVWASTPNGNKKLDAAYKEAKEKPGSCPVFLFFSVNTSGQFVGVAEMVGPVDFNKTLEYWQQDKWSGYFPLKWHIVKDVPNNVLKHIILENNESKPVTNSRDTQEVKLEQGIEMLKLFKSHANKTSILEDFPFYDTREKIMRDRKAKQQQLHKKVLPDGEKNEKDVANIKSITQMPSELDSALHRDTIEDANGDQNAFKENVKASKDVKTTPEKLPFAKVVANGC
ncbi:evolutionarily conserved C-terminal region 2 [Rhynchospora pubera]|uniref:YTH domain-containing family protein n=1 Tax=Rhynchospora pubera TaxID=906938 RepID=A0AAV8H0K3_9POAL|nr:evolutionarily conserved C-terminal region 2 [Rhynchospora pubera]